jgi:hypothetical protein
LSGLFYICIAVLVINLGYKLALFYLISVCSNLAYCLSIAIIVIEKIIVPLMTYVVEEIYFPFDDLCY